MGAPRIMVIVVALVAAIGAVVLVRGLTAAKAPAAQAAPVVQNVTQVLVAKRDLPIGTKLQAGDVAWQAWPEGDVGKYIVNGAPPAPAAEGKLEKAAQAVQAAAAGAGQMESVYGAVVREPILAGEPIIQRKIVRGGEGGYMAVMLRPGMRAMGVNVSVETGGGGFILPGDRVDVLQSREVAGAASRVTQVIVQNVRVLAIDQKTAPDKDAQAIVGAVATLEVDPSSAAALVEARSVDRPLFLALRSYADLGGPSGVGARIAAADAANGIRVFRDGAVTEVEARR